jgi:hypothetical protein
MRADLWSEVATRRLRNVVMAGVPFSAIATELGRSVSAVKNKATMQDYRRTGRRRKFTSRDERLPALEF